jgi:hypothetical protein
MILLASGALIRAWGYMQNQCLWQDEAVWANGIIERSLKDIATAANGYNIQMPLGLGAVTKVLVDSFGMQEYIWRFIPFVCSILSLVFYDYFLRLLTGTFVRNLALASLAVLSLPVYYAAEFRAYSIDLLGLLVLFDLGMKVREDPCSGKQWLLLAGTGLIMPWFSFAPIFLLPAVIGVLLWDFWRSSLKFSFVMACATILSWEINFFALYVLFYQKMDALPFYLSAFQDGFYSGPWGWQAGPWLFERLKVMAFSVGFEWPTVTLIFAAFGVYHVVTRLPMPADSALVFRRRLAVKLSAAVIFLVLLAAACHKYPLVPRLQLFLIPIFIWFMAEGICAFSNFKWRWTKIVALLLAILLCLGSAGHTWRERLWVKPDMKKALSLLSEGQRPGDRIIMVEASQYAYWFYRVCLAYDIKLSAWAGLTNDLKDFDGVEFFGIRTPADWRGRLYRDGSIRWHRNSQTDPPASFNTFLPPGRMWVLFSDSHNEAFLTAQFEQRGKLLQRWKSSRIALYLYDFPKN